MKLKYKVGDRVILLYSDHSPSGSVGRDLKGVIVDINGVDHYGIKFDKKVFGCHNLGCRCENGHGWWISTSLRCLVDEKEVITGVLEVGDI